MSEMSILKEHGVHVELHVLLLFSMSERSILKNMESLLNFMYSYCLVYLRGVFLKNMESLLNFMYSYCLVYLRGVSLKNMESLLNFMYQGEVNINQSRITEFLATAEDLKIKG